MSLELPMLFCWTRFGTEAGQSLEQILRHKEEERSANDGVFLWGIGNAVGPGMEELVRRCNAPEVLFSPIAGKARKVDVAPDSVVAWTSGETNDGRQFPLPTRSLVTSRQSTSSASASHYALICFSREPLVLRVPFGSLTFSSLRNLLSGSRVGASQVTAVVARDRESPIEGRVYEVALRAHLVHPYFIRLRQPVVLSSCSSAAGWAGAVDSAWSRRAQQSLTQALQGGGT